jgi:hypothetical protein
MKLVPESGSLLFVTDHCPIAKTEILSLLLAEEQTWPDLCRPIALGELHGIGIGLDRGLELLSRGEVKVLNPIDVQRLRVSPSGILVNGYETDPWDAGGLREVEHATVYASLVDVGTSGVPSYA